MSSEDAVMRQERQIKPPKWLKAPDAWALIHRRGSIHGAFEAAHPAAARA